MNFELFERSRDPTARQVSRTDDSRVLKMRSVFDRCDIVSEGDLRDAATKSMRLPPHRADEDTRTEDERANESSMARRQP
jgi:hypothetical protein